MKSEPQAGWYEENEEPKSGWQDLMEFYERVKNTEGSWVFRGQKRAEWGLETSIERAAKRFGVKPEKMPDLEKGLVRRFKRQAKLYLQHIPKGDEDDRISIEWLSLMRHYGAPTRIMDWTYSFFVAVHFAIEVTEPDKPFAIWALNRSWLVRRAEEALPDDLKEDVEKSYKDKRKTYMGDRVDTMNNILTHQPPCVLAYPMASYEVNERMFLQQGEFLAPGDVRRTMEENMKPLFNGDGSSGNLKKLTMCCDKDSLCEIIENLHRMNINRATLLPGLEGFARSLENLIAIDGTIVPYSRAGERSG